MGLPGMISEPCGSIGEVEDEPGPLVLMMSMGEV